VLDGSENRLQFISFQSTQREQEDAEFTFEADRWYWFEIKISRGEESVSYRFENIHAQARCDIPGHDIEIFSDRENVIYIDNISLKKIDCEI